MSKYEAHEAAAIFPLDEEHVAELASDIREHGLRTPVELLAGKVIDGRRRLLACEQAGVKPSFVEVETDDPVAYVVSLNLHRRHLTPTQRAMAAARAREIYDRAAKERQKASGGDRKSGDRKSVVENLPQPNDGKSRDQAGRAFGVSGKLVDMATNVLRRGTPELVAAVEADLVAVSTAERAVGISEGEQRRILDNVASGRIGKRQRPAAERDGDDGEPVATNGRDPKGIILANEAINCLQRIPKNDALRKRGFQLVSDWIRKHK